MATKNTSSKPTLRERAENAERDLEAARTRELCLRWYIRANNHFPPSNTWVAVTGPRMVAESLCRTDELGMICQVILRGTQEEQDEENNLSDLAHDPTVMHELQREARYLLEAFRSAQRTLRAA